MNKLSIFLLVAGFAFAAISLYLSLQYETAFARFDAAGVSIDAAADGGAAGFAILAGLCFLSSVLAKDK